MPNDIFVQADGDDLAPGTIDQPVKTLQRAIQIAGSRSAAITLRGGVYPISSPITIQRGDLTIQGVENETVVLSGGDHFKAEWQLFRNGIYQTQVAGQFPIDQLFVNERQQRVARYPNFDSSAKFFGGTSADAIQPDRVQRWKKPVGGYVHALHQSMWGSKHYQIIGKTDDHQLILKGGWQENRGGNPDNPDFIDGYHEEYLYVENIFEELDAQKEWYFDEQSRTLYLMPEENVDLDQADLVATSCKQLIRVEADQALKNITFRNLTFKYTGHLFMEPYERLLRGDWSIARQAALYLENTVDSQIIDCTFSDLGGNGIFISNHNRDLTISQCLFQDLGESAICLVGNDKAVRSGAIRYGNDIALDQIDRTPGPKLPDYPADCLIENNLIRRIGQIGKQTAGIFISKAKAITIRHNSMYDMPRAAVCINDGTWGGHLIEFNDLFQTVQESGDHGPFNSWGRDRHWQTSHAGGFEKDDQSQARRDCRLDTEQPVIIRNNRFAHTDGFSWGIDLDDGTSNYHVSNNLCLGCSYKLREGFLRRIENNICVGPNPPGKHCCYQENQDLIQRNIIVNTRDGVVWHGIHHQPDQLCTVDYQLFWTTTEAEPTFISSGQRLNEYDEEMTLTAWQEKGHDKHSLFADPMFIDPASGDYRVSPESPAFKLGFKNFPMDQFGTQKAEFQEMISIDRPSLYIADGLMDSNSGRDKKEHIWKGATIRNLVGWEEMSAAAMGEETGVIFIRVPTSSEAEAIGFKSGDVALTLNDEKCHTINDFLGILSALIEAADNNQQIVCRVTGNPPDRDIIFRDLIRA